MTIPNPQVPVPEPVLKATKALYSSFVLAGGVVALVAKSFADGHLSWAEGYEIIGAVVAAGGAIYATWKTRNEPKES